MAEVEEDAALRAARYRQLAEDAVGLAEAATDPAIVTAYLDLATKWTLLSERARYEGRRYNEPLRLGGGDTLPD
jgi:hypothetical protein